MMNQHSHFSSLAFLAHVIIMFFCIHVTYFKREVLWDGKGKNRWSDRMKKRKFGTKEERKIAKK